MSLLLEVLDKADEKLELINNSITALDRTKRRLALVLLKIWYLSIRLVDKIKFNKNRKDDILNIALIKLYLKDLAKEESRWVQLVRYLEDEKSLVKLYMKLIDEGILVDLHRKLTEGSELEVVNIILNYVYDLMKDEQKEEWLLEQEKANSHQLRQENLFEDIITELESKVSNNLEKLVEDLEKLVGWLSVESL